jgi:hypothetical protein
MLTVEAELASQIQYQDAPDASCSFHVSAGCSSTTTFAKQSRQDGEIGRLKLELDWLKKCPVCGSSYPHGPGHPREGHGGEPAARAGRRTRSVAICRILSGRATTWVGLRNEPFRYRGHSAYTRSDIVALATIVPPFPAFMLKTQALLRWPTAAELKPHLRQRRLPPGFQCFLLDVEQTCLSEVPAGIVCP